MHRFTKIFVTVLTLGLISSALYASKESNSTPFPVPLSCYSEDYGSPNFLAERCDQVHGSEASGIRKEQVWLRYYPTVLVQIRSI